MTANTDWIKTVDDVEDYVRDGDDNDTTAPIEIERIFAIVYGRPPDAHDREADLWSLICSGVSH